MAVRHRRRDFDIFSLSFLDVISCGFGAIVMLVLISNNAEAPSSDDTATARQLLNEVLQAEAGLDDLNAEMSEAEDEEESKAALLKALTETLRRIEASVSARARDASDLDADLRGLAVVQQSLQRAATRTASAQERDEEEVGGIPVDSDYVVFIIDTSGSMQAIWSRVVQVVENVIRIHPKIKGFQILNDNGSHILSAYQGKWIPDTPRRRDNVIDLLRSWKSASNSSPVEGLEVALKRYAKPGERVSVYIFGDDYSGSSYDPVISTLDRLNTNRATGKKLAKVHAIGFLSPHATDRFGTLMREVTRRNGGTFLALPK